MNSILSPHKSSAERDLAADTPPRLTDVTCLVLFTFIRTVSLHDVKIQLGTGWRSWPSLLPSTAVNGHNQHPAVAAASHRNRSHHHHVPVLSLLPSSTPLTLHLFLFPFIPTLLFISLLLSFYFSSVWISLHLSHISSSLFRSLPLSLSSSVSSVLLLSSFLSLLPSLPFFSSLCFVKGWRCERNCSPLNFDDVSD